MEKMQDIEILGYFTEWKNRYFDYLFMKNSSTHTTRTISMKIEHFLRFIADNEPNMKISEFSHFFITNYLNSVKNDILAKKMEKLQNPGKKSRKSNALRKNVSDNTINLYLSAIKMFLNFIGDNNDELIDFTPILKKIKKNRSNIYEVQRFNENDRALILNHLNKSRNDFLDGKLTQKKAMGLFAIVLLYYTGMRASEVISLSKDDFVDFDEQNYLIQIVGKGNKIRSVYIKKTIAEPFLDVANDGKLFNFAYQELYNKCNRFLAKAGINHIKSGCHIFRHNIGDMLVSKDVNLATIQKILGHADIQTTVRYYTRVSEQTSIDALDKINS